MSFKITAPVLPNRGTRGIDAYGAGGFRAPRDGGSRKHEGLDFVSAPGDAVVAPCSGVITHIGVAYEDSSLGSIHITSHDGEHTVKLLYAQCIKSVGREVKKGDRVGYAQNVAEYWETRSPRDGRMTNHVHLELREGDVVLDPALFLDDEDAA